MAHWQSFTGVQVIVKEMEHSQACWLSTCNTNYKKGIATIRNTALTARKINARQYFQKQPPAFSALTQHNSNLCNTFLLWKWKPLHQFIQTSSWFYICVTVLQNRDIVQYHVQTNTALDNTFNTEKKDNYSKKKFSALPPPLCAIYYLFVIELGNVLTICELHLVKDIFVCERTLRFLHLFPIHLLCL